MVTILYNYAKVMGKDVSNIEGMAIQNFEDWTNTSAYAKTAVRWAFNQKIILGESSTTLGPKDTATRAQASIIISRVN